MQKITPFLWFDGRAEEAMNFYTSIFKDSSIVQISYFEGGGPDRDHKFATGTFTLNGQQFMALDGGPMFEFTPAISMFVSVETQDELDYYWDKLLEGGKESRCGWLEDKFGLSWQIVPTILSEVLNGADETGAKRAMQAMMQMVKLDIAALKKAYNSE